MSRTSAVLMSALVISASAPAAAIGADWTQEQRRNASVVVAPAPAKPAAEVIAGWPERARALAAAMILEHGAPDETSPGQITWRDRGPWTMIAVYRDAESAERPNNLLQAVAYEVPIRRWRALSDFDRGVAYEPVRRELVARSDREETNLLALNLADEIIQGRRTATDAARYYDKAVELSYAGKSSSYMEELRFSPLSRRFFQKTDESDLRLEREIDRLEKANDRPGLPR